VTDAPEGGCECGAVRYRLLGAPEAVNCCHCRDCQRITGSAFAINAQVATDAIALLAEQPNVSSLHRPGHGTTRAWRCPTCETLLYADHPLVGDAWRFLRVGTLDQPEALPPTAHFFVRSKHPWVTIPDDLPRYDTLPRNPA
jgi:hypothetical protein